MRDELSPVIEVLETLDAPIDAFVRDDCNWMPSGWQNKLLEMIGERGEELDNAEQAVVSANESLDRQFADTIGK